MPGQIIPITDLASGGVIADTPSLALGPNMFSDVKNVRFKDSAVRKMEGERIAVTNAGSSTLLHVAWWPHPDVSPNDGYYVIVYRTTGNVDEVIIRLASAPDTPLGTNKWGTTNATAATMPVWQSLLFDGGRTIILNNGIETPRYLNIADDTQNFLALPGWDSYLVNEPIISSLIWNFVDIENINLGVLADLTGIDGDIGTLDATFMFSTDYRVRNNTANPIVQDLGQWQNMFIGEGGAALTAVPSAGDNVTSRASFALPATDVGDVARIGDQRVIMTVAPANADLSYQTYSLDDVLEPANFGFSLGTDTDSQTNFIVPRIRELNEDGSILQEGVSDGDTINISVFNLPAIQVRCGTLRAFGQFLVAGNLTETRVDDPDAIVRRLAGTVRTSDVAPPGTVPANWNPFKIGANTADEFTLSSTGVVQDMAVLQGNLMIYTNNSIHSLQNTGNPTIPFALRPVSESYGCQTKDAVLEFDGRHVVIGSNDIYQFQGHPGSIASIADARVRRDFFENLNPVREQDLFMLINRREDEIWICYPDGRDGGTTNTRSLIWNYRDNTWTIRKMSPFTNGVMAPVLLDGSINPNILKPLLANGQTVLVADAEDTYAQVSPIQGYESYVERNRLALTPEFDTETLQSMAILAETPGVATGETAQLQVTSTGTFAPADVVDLSMADATRRIQVDNFNIKFTVDSVEEMDYKADLRTQGRFLNYRISDLIVDRDTPANTVQRELGWNLIGMQFEVGKGGTR